MKLVLTKEPVEPTVLVLLMRDAVTGSICLYVELDKEHVYPIFILAESGHLKRPTLSLLSAKALEQVGFKLDSSGCRVAMKD
jgi:hypothetical protein